jgi:hypothetical protein
MRFSRLAVGSFCMALGLGVVAGCDDDEDSVDEGVSTGGTSGYGTGGTTGGSYGTGGTGGSGTTGTGGSYGTGGTGGSGTTGTGGTGGSGTTGTGGTGGGTVTYAQVKPIFVAKCTPCHSAGGIGSTFHTLADSNADAHKTAINAECQGQTKGACTLTRVADGEMPMGKGCTGDPSADAANPACLTQEEQDMLAAWIAGGLM